MILSLYEVSQSGAISLVAANVAFTNLQWKRRMSSCGEFAASIVGRFPAPWPGRYLLTRDDAANVGVVEKVEATESARGEAVSVSGRFAESMWARWHAGPDGAAVSGANWRQAVTAALGAWHMGDVPELLMGEGTEAPTGSSYELRVDKGGGALDAILNVTRDNGAYPVVSYDRDVDGQHLVVSIVDGRDRTRGQTALPVQLFSLAMGNASGATYSGDYSVGASEVFARAEKGAGDAVARVDATVAVPGFDAATMWAARAYEDVSQLVGDAPTQSEVDRAARLRCYDHQPDLAIDATVTGYGYREWWDLGDLVECEMPSISLQARERVEEVREVAKAGGVTVEATLGTREISRAVRAAMGRR